MPNPRIEGCQTQAQTRADAATGVTMSQAVTEQGSGPTEPAPKVTKTSRPMKSASKYNAIIEGLEVLLFYSETKGGKGNQPSPLSPKDQHLLNTKGPAPPGWKQTKTGTGSSAEVCCIHSFPQFK